MKRKRYTEPQIVFALQQAEAGAPPEAPHGCRPRVEREEHVSDCLDSGSRTSGR